MFGRKKRSLSDFDEEIQAHLDLEAEEFKEDGLSEEEARYAARRKFGNVTIARERFYEAGRWLWLDTLVRNLGFAWRLMRRQMGSTIAVVGILALAIGVTTAVFSLVNALIFVPLPYRDADRLVTFGYGGVSPDGHTPNNVENFKLRAPAFEDVAVYGQSGVDLLGAGEAMHLTVAEVTVNFINVMGAAPRLGRLFYPEDEIGGSGGVIRFNESGRVYSEKEEKALDRICPALISERLWRSRFSESPDVLGKLVTLNGRPITIIGVLPSRFDFPTNAQVWTPTFHFSNYFRVADSNPFASGWIARIRPSVPFEQAARQYHDVLYRAFIEKPGWDTVIDRIVTETTTRIIGDVIVKHPFGIQPLRTTLSYGGKTAWLLLIAAILVMLIAATNVAGLIMARILFRQQEFALRQALGASRLSIFGMLLIEHTLIAAAGGIAGLLVAAISIQGLRPLLPPDWPPYASVGIDPRVLLFTLGVVIIVGLLAGLASAFFLFHMRGAAGTLLPGERAGVPRRIVKWRAALIFVETALALALLSSSGIFLKDYINRSKVDWGFNAKNLLMLNIARVGDNSETMAKNRFFYDEVLERMRAIPGVRFASGAKNLDWMPRSQSTVMQFETDDADGNTISTIANYHVVASDFFAAVGYRIIAGRDFDNREMKSSQNVAIINAAMARGLKMDGQAVGKSVFYARGYSRSAPTPYSVIGVVDSGDQSRIYYPQGRDSDGSFNFILRTSGKSAMIAQAVREAIFAVDKSQSIVEMGWVENLLAWRLREPRSIAALVSVFAFLGYALVLAGVYGAINHATSSRLREYGIRLALGAHPFRLWLKASVANLPSLVAGIAAGTGLSWYAIKIIRARVPRMDPALLDFRANLEMLILFSLALLVTAIADGAFASRDILRVDPNTVLRHE